MKLLFSIGIVLLILSCKSTSQVLEYTYTQTSQMGKTTISVSEDSIIKSYAGRGNPSRLAFVTTAQNWTDLNAAMKTIELKNLGNLQSPTNKRQTDRAPYGRLMFTTKDSTYKSLDFDGTDSPKELKPVMKVFIEIMNMK